MSTYKKDPVVLLLDPRGISKYNSVTVTKRLDEYAKQLAIQTSKNPLALVVLSSSKSFKLKSKILKYVKIYYICKYIWRTNFSLYIVYTFYKI